MHFFLGFLSELKYYSILVNNASDVFMDLSNRNLDLVGQMESQAKRGSFMHYSLASNKP